MSPIVLHDDEPHTGHSAGAKIVKSAVLYLVDTYPECRSPLSRKNREERSAVTILIALETILAFTE